MRCDLLNSPTVPPILLIYTQSQKKRTMNSLTSSVTQGQDQVPTGRFILDHENLKHVAKNLIQKFSLFYMNSNFWVLRENCEQFWNVFFSALSYPHHRQNEMYYKVHRSTLFPKSNATSYGAFLLRLSVYRYVCRSIPLGYPAIWWSTVIKWSLIIGIWDGVWFLACERCKMYPEIICHTWFCPLMMSL